jgi:hypothetical protein
MISRGVRRLPASNDDDYPEERILRSVVRFQRIPYIGERGLEIGRGTAHRDLSNDPSLEPSQSRLLGTQGHDQVKPGMPRVVGASDAEGEVQRSVEVVA